MAILLHKDYADTMTSVSNKFIDLLMPEANGEFVKVYLYLLRSISGHTQNCTISAIADHMNHTEADVVRALKYWERMNVLSLDCAKSGEICGIHFLDLDMGEQMSAAESSDEAEEMPARTPSGRNAQTIATANIIVAPSADPAARREYSLDEIKQFLENDSISELFFIIETYLKHPLSATDTNTVLYWYDTFHFPADLIIYLVEYCISKGHSSIRYMDKVAMNWNDNNIATVEQAKENAAMHSQAYYSVMKAFGISGRNLVDAETAYIRKWTKDYAFDLPLILEACKRTMTATHQPSFEYADSILTSWHKNQVHTIDDIKALDKKYSGKAHRNAPVRETPKHNKFNNFNQRDYDYDKLEQMLLTTSIH